MGAQQELGPTARVLRIATATEVVFLIVSAFFLFTEHRAHYLGALPYGLTAIGITVFLVFLAEHRRHRVSSGAAGNQQPGKGDCHAQ
jgi:hypothetical protein